MICKLQRTAGEVPREGPAVRVLVTLALAADSAVGRGEDLVDKADANPMAAGRGEDGVDDAMSRRGDELAWGGSGDGDDADNTRDVRAGDLAEVAGDAEVVVVVVAVIGGDDITRGDTLCAVAERGDLGKGARGEVAAAVAAAGNTARMREMRVCDPIRGDVADDDDGVAVGETVDINARV